ncbi:MAG: hypothetical protein ABEJ79_12565 [Halolamina sp.]
MVRDRLNNGVRIAELLASEVDADGGDMDALAVTDADPDVEPTADGALAYAVVEAGASNGRSVADDGDDGDDTTTLAEVYVQPDRARVEFLVGQDGAAAAAREADLRVRPKAVRPPRTLVFVEDGAEAKRVRAAFAAAVDGD